MPPADTDLTQRNRETVQRFCEIIFNEHKTAAAVDFIQDDYIQHSHFLADGRQPFIDYFSDFFAEYPRARLHVKRIIAEGDYVVVHSHFVRDPADRGTAIADIFRLDNSRLAEHWDVIQEVPARAQNKNSMF
jgi:predicted SnoaL-like aldol condensation-catalyzing enzyme